VNCPDRNISFNKLNIDCIHQRLCCWDNRHESQTTNAKYAESEDIEIMELWIIAVFSSSSF